ncbi:efflux RND transporter periplasmic adaptor subunit [Candidatus Uabimicrobium amorphum]|uniref:Hemolysin secretion protein D n=1 Tax=Uabimicrobium amorphum TaxID=2596890 RepID=A0A5S9IL84_UABAM|nr:efflux RND transporter periplasmic adaptor subunit [Candidatus Uabimicrobium amorphum]BBM83774.1 hemolysin secretion protein D [Candidatus Uabimicrobium amorphum]
MQHLFCVLVVFIFIIGCGQGENSTSPSNKKSGGAKKSTKKQASFRPPVQVEVGKIREKHLKVKVDIVGTTTALRKAVLSAAIAGEIVKINLQEGMTVTKGQPLVQIDTYSWKAKVAEKKAECLRWEAEIEKLKNGYIEQEIKRAAAVLQEKEAALKRLEAEKNRQQDLLKQNGIARSEWDAARFSFDEMAAQVEQARAELKKMKDGSRFEDIKIASAHLKTMQAQLRQAEDSLNNTTIKAPFSGMISKKYVELGEWISSGTQIADLVDLSQVRVQVSIPEKYISLVRLKMKAKVKMDAFPGWETWGTVSAIIPRTEGLARNFPVELIIDNPKGNIYEGMFCRVEGVLREEAGVLLVHRDAFIHQQGKISLARITKERSVETIEIVTGVREGEWFEIVSSSSPLKKDDIVVVTNNNNVYPGAKVIITKGL